MRIGGQMDHAWGKPRERRLLGALLAHAGRSVPLETLKVWIWDDAEPQNPRQAFHTYANGIRNALHQVSNPPRLQVQNGHFLLEVDKESVDHYRFRELFAEARTHEREGGLDRAGSLVEDALVLWRGLPLADLASARADAWRNRFVRNVWLPANALLIKAFLAAERFDDALERLDDLQSDHPHHLSLAVMRLSTLYGMDRPAEASEYFLDLHRHFRDTDPNTADRLRQQHDEMLAPIHGRDESRRTEPAPPPHRLLHDILDFTGREDLLDAMDAATTTSDGGVATGVVIVDGMAGVGKTAMVTRWAHRARHRFPDGDIFVDLNGFSASARIDQSTVVEDILMALGEAPHGIAGRRPMEMLLRRALANRRMLVILDNVADAAHVSRLVPLLAGSLVVITSRHRLGSLVVSGARRVGVEPMSPAEANELISRRLGVRVQVDQERRERMVAVCGGLPLAIEVLADHVARVPAAELPTFADGLDHYQLLTEIGEHGEGAVNVRALFTSSYLALAPAERRLFCLLALHPGPDIGVQVARACDGRSRAETTGSLSVLISTHLLTEPEQIGRYRYHDLIREFATECAELDEDLDDILAAGERILCFYLGSANNAVAVLYPSEQPPPPVADAPDVEVLTFADPAEARSWLDLERSNLVSAIRNPAYLGRHDHLLWRLVDLVTIHFDRRGDFESSAELRRLAVAAARRCGHRKGEASSLIALGMVLLTLGEHAEARSSLAAALSLCEELGGERRMAATLHQLGRVEFHRGEPAAALDHYRRSLELAQRIDDKEALCWVHRGLGEVYLATDQHDLAIEHLHQAKLLAERTGDTSAYGSILAKIGSAYCDLGEFPLAAIHCGRGLDAVEEVDLAVTAEVLVVLAEIALARGVAEDAVRFAQRAVRVCERSGDVVHEADARNVLGDARLASAELRDAVLAWTVAADYYHRLGNPKRASYVQAKIDGLPALDVRLPDSRPSFVDIDDHDRVN